MRNSQQTSALTLRADILEQQLDCSEITVNAGVCFDPVT